MIIEALVITFAAQLYTSFIAGGALSAYVLYKEFRKKKKTTPELAAFEATYSNRQELRQNFLNNVVPEIDHQIETNNQETATQIERFENTVTNLADTASAIDNEVVNLKQMVAESKETIVSQQQQLAELITNLQAKEIECTQATNNLKACQQQLTEKEKELNNTLTTVNNTVEQLSLRSDELLALNQKMITLEADNKAKNAQLQKLEQGKTALLAELKQRNLELTQSLETNKQLQNIIKNHQPPVKEMSQQHEKTIRPTNVTHAFFSPH